MTHRFPIKEIALQSGLGTATVDRVLNNRAHVSPQTKARVTAAIAELEAQEQQLSAKGRRMFVDLVIEAPARFSDEIKRAVQIVLPQTSAAVFRPRFHVQEIMSDDEVLATLDRIERRGSHGLCLKVRDTDRISQRVDQLVARGIPVITLVTDLPGTQRNGYVGLDNANAGRSAAYLLAKSVTVDRGTLLATRSQGDFFGEAERHAHFLKTIKTLKPNLDILDVSGGAGLFANTLKRLAPALKDVTDLVAVYSMGGGNQAILAELNRPGDARPVFIAHDLDAENLSLLAQGQIDFVLHHDLIADMRNFFQLLAAQHGLVAPLPDRLTSDIQIVTPFNVPAAQGLAR
jgi:LacI family transcriptional regulator